MKKGQILDGIVQRVDFPGKGLVSTEEGIVSCKGVLPGEKVRVQVKKARNQGAESGTRRAEGMLVEVLEKASDEIESPCPHFEVCGGCSYLKLPYEKQLKLKEQQVLRLLKPFLLPVDCEGRPADDRADISDVWLGIKGSPISEGYRNKMEFSFGDEFKDGPMALGLHKKGSFYDIVTTDRCRIVDEDYRRVLRTVLAYAEASGYRYFHKQKHTGYYRHLLVRKAAATGEILIAIVTATRPSGVPDLPAYAPEAAERIERDHGADLLEPLKEQLLALDLDGTITGILHIYNDNPADMVRSDHTEILYGRDYFYEEILGLRFKITPFSFFQTNTRGCEVLYSTARDFLKDIEGGKVIFDLYSGTGTIAQLMSPVADHVIGVEIVEEAVEAAGKNAAMNGIDNCTFLAGDVLKVLDEIEEKPDYIILDPPRDGIHPRALRKIMAYGVPRILYISCKPTSLARDLEVLTAGGYHITKACCIDQFPGTVHVETVVLMSRVEQ